MQAFFFGTYKTVGHYLFNPGMHKAGFNLRHWAASLDNDYPARSATGITRYFGNNKPVPEKFTLLSMNDFTVDSRPGSHAVFGFEGKFSTEEAALLVQQIFPEVFNRIEAFR